MAHRRSAAHDVFVLSSPPLRSAASRAHPEHPVRLQRPRSAEPVVAAGQREAPSARRAAARANRRDTRNGGGTGARVRRSAVQGGIAHGRSAPQDMFLLFFFFMERGPPGSYPFPPLGPLRI